MTSKQLTIFQMVAMKSARQDRSLITSQVVEHSAKYFTLLKYEIQTPWLCNSYQPENYGQLLIIPFIISKTQEIVEVTYCS